MPGYYLGLHEDWNRHVFYGPQLKRAVASSSSYQEGFVHEEQWDPDAIENIRALPGLWDTTKHDHEQVPHVKMYAPQARYSGSYEYGNMMGFDNREGRMKTSFRATG